MPASIVQDYVAFIWGRCPGLVGPELRDIYAANNMQTLTEMVYARELAPDEFVRYGRHMGEAA